MSFRGVYGSRRCESSIEWCAKLVTLRDGTVRLEAVDASGHRVPNGKILKIKQQANGKYVLYLYDTVNESLGLALDARGHVLTNHN